MIFDFSFPDFTKCIEFNELHRMMGIEEIHLSPIPEGTFFRVVTKKIKHELIGDERVNFLNEFNSGIEFSPNEINTNRYGLLEINGHSCCIYIKEIHQSLNYYDYSPKYHLFECKTIQSMINDGRKSRYVATSRHDGYFNIVRQKKNKANSSIEKLEMCKNCLEILKQRGWWTPNFNLKDFFEEHKNSFSNTFTKEETIKVRELYSPNHDEIAKKYKEQVNYICQRCKVDCSKNKNLLHLHHKNGDGNDNTIINLEVLCVKCHSQQPRHNIEIFRKRDIKDCEILQKKQGIF